MYHLLVVTVCLSSTLVNGQPWITRFRPFESHYDLLASSPLLPSDFETRGRLETVYSPSAVSPAAPVTPSPVTTTTVAATAAPSSQRPPALVKRITDKSRRRIPLKSTVIGQQQQQQPRKAYPARNVSTKKIYEYGNQHAPSSSHNYRKKVLYYKTHTGSYAGRYEYVDNNSPVKTSNIAHSFIAYPMIGYHRTKNVEHKKQSSPSSKESEKESLEVSRVSSNPPEQLATVDAKTITVNGPKFIRRRPNSGAGRSASLLDFETSRLNPDQSLGNDMLYYPEPSSDDDSGVSSPDKNGISNDPNSEFVIIK